MSVYLHIDPGRWISRLQDDPDDTGCGGSRTYMIMAVMASKMWHQWSQKISIWLRIYRGSSDFTASTSHFFRAVVVPTFPPQHQSQWLDLLRFAHVARQVVLDVIHLHPNGWSNTWIYRWSQWRWSNRSWVSHCWRCWSSDRNWLSE